MPALHGHEPSMDLDAQGGDPCHCPPVHCILGGEVHTYKNSSWENPKICQYLCCMTTKPGRPDYIKEDKTFAHTCAA